MASFDPYHKWLGIQPKDQPPNHYRLLGIELFEEDADVVDFAADKQMALLKQCAIGPHSAHSQRLLNEVAAARLCLLKAAERARYDTELRARLAHSKRPVSAQQQPEGNLSKSTTAASSSDENEPFNFAFEPVVRTPRATKNMKLSLPTAALGAVGLLVCCAIAFSFLAPAKLPIPMNDPPRPPTDPSLTPELARVITNSIGMELVRIPAEEFKMGSPEGPLGSSDEKPRHVVKITRPFRIGAREVTQHEYETVMGSTTAWTVRNPTYPASNLNWHEAVEFCRRLSNKEAKAYRLPTEAEWEYACRAGEETAWNFGDEDDNLGLYAWYKRNAQGSPHPVGTRKPNGFGLFDMYGNVSEWCQDWYGQHYYSTDSRVDPLGPPEGSDRIARGGSWENYEIACRSAYRATKYHGSGSSIIGFRVVLDDVPLRSSAAQSHGGKKSDPTAGKEVALESEDASWVSLFNGTNLKGWFVDGGYTEKWRVEQGVIVADGDDWKTRSYLLTDREYSDYILRLEFSFDGKGSGSGIGVRSRRGEELPFEDGTPISDHPLFKLVDSLTLVGKTGKKLIDDTGTTLWIRDAFTEKPDRAAKQQPPGSWNQVEIEVRGNTMRASVNGEPVIHGRTVALGAVLPDGSVPALNRLKGNIGLQKHTGRVRFRNIRVKELPASKPDKN